MKRPRGKTRAVSAVRDGEWYRDGDDMVLRKAREVVTVRAAADGGWIICLHRPSAVYRLREPLVCSRASALDQAEWLLNATLLPEFWEELV